MHGEDFEFWPKQSLLLHYCTKKGYSQCVRYLVSELGFNIDVQRPKDLCTCLHVPNLYISFLLFFLFHIFLHIVIFLSFFLNNFDIE